MAQARPTSLAVDRISSTGIAPRAQFRKQRLPAQRSLELKVIIYLPSIEETTDKLKQLLVQQKICIETKYDRT